MIQKIIKVKAKTNIKFYCLEIPSLALGVYSFQTSIFLINKQMLKKVFKYMGPYYEF